MQDESRTVLRLHGLKRDYEPFCIGKYGAQSKSDLPTALGFGDEDGWEGLGRVRSTKVALMICGSNQEKPVGDGARHNCTYYAGVKNRRAVLRHQLGSQSAHLGNLIHARGKGRGVIITSYIVCSTETKASGMFHRETNVHPSTATTLQLAVVH